MIKTQESKLNMYNAVAAWCDESETITASLPAFAPELLAFRAIIAEIDAVAQLESQIITGFAKNKAELREALSIGADKLAAALFAFATAEGDFVLQHQRKRKIRMPRTPLLNEKSLSQFILFYQLLAYI